MTLVLALALGFAAGVLAGLFGVGGGLLFVPTLLVLGLGQVHAEATSLLAVIPTAALGTWRQHRYGNVRWRAAALLAAGSVVGAYVGVRVAVSLPEETLRRLFAGFLLVTAAHLAYRARRA